MKKILLLLLLSFTSCVHAQRTTLMGSTSRDGAGLTNIVGTTNLPNLTVTNSLRTFSDIFIRGNGSFDSLSPLYSGSVLFKQNGVLRYLVGSGDGGNGASGDFVIDNYNDAGAFQGQVLNIRATNGYVGINTSNPKSQLDVNGSATVRGSVTNTTGTYYGNGAGLTNIPGGVLTGSILSTINGNVGVGIADPKASFTHLLQIHDINVAGNAALTLSTPNEKYSIAIVNTDWRLFDETNVAYRLTVLSNGNVGVNTVSPQSQIDVNGSATVRGVSTNKAASYFESGITASSINVTGYLSATNALLVDSTNMGYGTIKGTQNVNGLVLTNSGYGGNITTLRGRYFFDGFTDGGLNAGIIGIKESTNLISSIPFSILDTNSHIQLEFSSAGGLVIGRDGGLGIPNPGIGGIAASNIYVGNNSNVTMLANGTIKQSVGAPLSIASGSNTRAGNLVLQAGTNQTANTTITANSIVMLTRKTSGGTIGTAITYTLSAGNWFRVNSDNVLDTSTFSYFIIENP